MRVAFVTEVWHPTINGVATRLSATVDELCRAGHQVLVVAPAVGDIDRDNSSLRVRTVPTVRLAFLYGGQPRGLPLPRVDRYLSEFGPDVVHVVNPALLGIAGVVTARRRGIPLVCSYHIDLCAYASFYHLGWLRPLIRWVLRALHGRAAINLVTSGTAARQLVALGVPRVAHWERGVDLERFHPPASCPDHAVGPRTALYVGRLAEEKNLGSLAELASISDLRLVVVGDGPARAKLAGRLATGDVEFRGALSGDELAAAYRQADVFVFPSTTETLGLVLLEALASGLPVVAAHSPASAEVLQHCPAARLWPPGRPGALPAAIGDLLDSADRDTLAGDARRAVEGLGWSHATARLVEHYQATIAGSSGPRREPEPSRCQLRRFVAVGASNAAVDVAAFNVLALADPTRRPLQLAVYNTVAVTLALANSYWWNSRWTFRRPERHRPRWDRSRRRLLFVAQGALNLAVNDVVVVAAAAALRATRALTPTLAANAAKAAGMATASLVSFLAMRLVVFRQVRSEPVVVETASG